MDERTASSGADLTVGGKPLSAREAAAAIGVSERTIRRAIDRGELTASKRGGALQVASTDLVRYRDLYFGQAHQPSHVLRLVPPLRPVAAAVGRVPAPLTTFIGREREVASLLDLL